MCVHVLDYEERWWLVTYAVCKGDQPDKPDNEEGALQLAQVVDWQTEGDAHQEGHEKLLYHLAHHTPKVTLQTVQC